MTDTRWKHTGDSPVPLRAHWPRALTSWAYFLDFDGTLVELAARPDGVRVDEELRTTIDRLWRLTDGALAIVSGRSIRDIDRFLALTHVPVAGLHGAEVRGVDVSGRQDSRGRGALNEAPNEALNDLLNEAREQLEAVVSAHPDLVLEDKGLALALHYRQAPHLESTALAAMSLAVERLGPSHEVQHGKCVMELKPAAVSKGTAVRSMMFAPPFHGRTPVFVGDDVTDEDGFVAVNELHGISVKVGAGHTVARFRVAGVGPLRAWLDDHEAGANAPVHSGART